MHTNLIDFTREAAEQGDENAQYFLASFHHFGRAKGIPKDCAKAAHWYRKAAEQGHADAQYSLGVLHMSGDGVPQDFAEAVRWYRRIAGKRRTLIRTSMIGALIRAVLKRRSAMDLVRNPRTPGRLPDAPPPRRDRLTFNRRLC